MHDHYDRQAAWYYDKDEHTCYSTAEVAEAKQVMRAARRWAPDAVADELVERYDWAAAERDLSQED